MFLAMKQKRTVDPFRGVPISIVAYWTGTLLCALGILFCLLGLGIQNLFPSVKEWQPFWQMIIPVSGLLMLAGIAVIVFTRHIERLKRANYRCAGK